MYSAKVKLERISAEEVERKSRLLKRVRGNSFETLITFNAERTFTHVSRFDANRILYLCFDGVR